MPGQRDAVTLTSCMLCTCLWSWKHPLLFTFNWESFKKNWRPFVKLSFVVMLWQDYIKIASISHRQNKKSSILCKVSKVLTLVWFPFVLLFVKWEKLNIHKSSCLGKTGLLEKSVFLLQNKYKNDKLMLWNMNLWNQIK